MPEPAKDYEHAEVPIAFLNAVDSAFADLEETVAVVGYVLELHRQLPEEAGSVPAEVGGRLEWILMGAARRFRRELDGWFQGRRKALGRPVWDPDA